MAGGAKFAKAKARKLKNNKKIEASPGACPHYPNNTPPLGVVISRQIHHSMNGSLPPEYSPPLGVVISRQINLRLI